MEVENLHDKIKAEAKQIANFKTPKPNPPKFLFDKEIFSTVNSIGFTMKGTSTNSPALWM